MPPAKFAAFSHILHGPRSHIHAFITLSHVQSPVERDAFSTPNRRTDRNRKSILCGSRMSVMQDEDTTNTMPGIRIRDDRAPSRFVCKEEQETNKQREKAAAPS